MEGKTKEVTDFKLIAIRPLEGCSKEYHKVLKLGEFYSFYNNYKFETKGNIKGGEIKTITYKPSIADKLYNLKRADNEDLFISISAIVGKNGSGKSTLMELLAYCIYNLAFEKKILKSYQKGVKLKPIINLHAEVYYSSSGVVYCLKIDGENKPKIFPCKITKITNTTTEWTIYEKAINKNRHNIFENHFFYSIIINYSAYGLNSLHIGDWINALFHKNDGYQTPIVINPWREEGNMDINVENDLVKQRLLANLLEPIHDKNNPNQSLRNLSVGKLASKVNLKYNEAKIEACIRYIKKVGYNNDSKCLRQLYKSYTGANDFDKKSEIKEYQGIISYLNCKLIKTCKRYKPYNAHFKNKQFKNNSEFIAKLCEDKSHITFKLKQALNFLKYEHKYRGIYIGNERNLTAYKPNEITPFEITKEVKPDIETICKVISDVKREAKRAERPDIKDTTLDTIEVLPPSFLEPEIMLESAGNFKDMSSGEKQKIYCISSVVYHLMNLNSVFKNETVTSNRYIKYKYVNIMFDEVELYFHPDFQREFIHDLLDYIKNINPKNIKHIYGLNICFSTHSPFILSDIPLSNILLLREGEPQPEIRNLTFGANIHDLLKNSFFLEKGYMGEFAKNKINDTINYINSIKLEKELMKVTDKESESYKLQYTELTKLKERVIEFDAKKHIEIIKLIGEPILQIKLIEMYDEIINEKPELELAIIQSRIEGLTKLATKLKENN
ncbi:MAG TPA: hypothetical protein VK783_16475 [Bacteroidia bacterium]|jgi:hypothetical protein|nr:hypothetical protein [Bacteroidia bacterium]